MSNSERNFLEAFLEGAEAVIDLATENEAVKAVPVIGTAIKLLKGADDLRSRALQAKIHRFITEPSLVNSLEAGALKARLQDDAQSQTIGEILFLTVEKVTDLQKPVLLAQVFSAYLDQVIEADTLLLLTHAIDTGFIGDLKYFLENEENNIQDAPTGVRLLPTGLVEVVEFRLTTLGVALRSAIQYARGI